MTEVTLSTPEFKALSSKTRTEIVKLLRERNYTLTELSQKLGMSAPTVKQHLSVLLDSGLIELRDEGRKWKYYTLTRKGRKIFVPETQFLVVIALTSFALLALLFILFYPLLITPSYAGVGVEEKVAKPLAEEAPVLAADMYRVQELSQAELEKLEACAQFCDSCNPYFAECNTKCEKCVSQDLK